MNAKGLGQAIEINIFGCLRKYMDEKGLPYTIIKHNFSQPRTAYHIIQDLGLPADKVEAVSCNSKIINIYDVVSPGNRLSFFPYGRPGPYIVFLGILKENEKRKRVEKG